MSLACVSPQSGDGGTGGGPPGDGGHNGGAGGVNGSLGGATGTGGHTTTGAGGSGSGGAGGAQTGAGGAQTGAGGSSAGGTTGGTGGAAGTSGAGGASAAWTCPAGPFTGITIPTGSTATRINGAPPSDSFNTQGNAFTNVEGPVWIGGSLYVSEMLGSPNPPPARIIKISATDDVSVAVADSGSNGMAVDNDGNLVTANHGVGGIVQFSLPDFTKTTLIATYMGARFNSPNDLTVRSDGTIYFTDPTFQAPSPNPQSTQRAYMFKKGASSASVIVDNASNPNGITLSLDQKFLFVGDGSGVTRYPLNTDGTVVAASKVAIDTTDLQYKATDGMAIDCAGNLYVVRVNEHDIIVVKDPTGTATTLAQIKIAAAGQLTNAAFGGTDHQTLYVTAQGTGTQRGVFKIQMPLPGMPY
jgi:gluconolactonase